MRDDRFTANQYRFNGQTIVGEDEVYPDRKLAIPVSSRIETARNEVKEPTFGIDAIWIEAHKQTEADHKVMWWPETVLTTHVSHMMTKYAGEPLGQMMFRPRLTICPTVRQAWFSLWRSS